MINVIKTAIPGVVIIEPKVFGDARGYFFESFSERDFNEAMTPILGHGIKFVQDNESMSSYGVMRGLHFQTMPYTQSKLVRCVKGAVLDVAVDIRKGSPTFGKHVSAVLSAENKRQFYIPKGFAHGFIVLEDNTLFSYKCDDLYCPQADRGMLFSDPELKIEWPKLDVEIKLSEKDQKHPCLKDIEPWA